MSTASNAYSLGVRLAGQSWSKWLIWLQKTLRNTCWPGFKLAMALGLRAHRIITAFSMSTSTESMLLSLSTYMHPYYDISWHGRYIKKRTLSVGPFWCYFWGLKRLKNPNFPGLCHKPHWGTTGELTLLPRAGGKETHCPIPNNPTLVLGHSMRPRFYGSQGLTHYRVVCCQP